MKGMMDGKISLLSNHVENVENTLHYREFYGNIQ